MWMIINWTLYDFIQVNVWFYLIFIHNYYLFIYLFLESGVQPVTCQQDLIQDLTHEQEVI